MAATRLLPRTESISMRKPPWATCIWPGLPYLWLDGAWSGLGLALAAAVLLDVLLLSTLLWVEWFDPWVVKSGWAACVGLWLASAIHAVKRYSSNDNIDADSIEGLFRRAQAEYLQGDHFQAEATLTGLLAREPRDAEARLLLATLLRHTQRYEEAEDQLKQLSRFETAARWQIEITGERALLKRLRKQQRDGQRDQPKSEALTDTIQLPSTSHAA
jgi:tetratricopeptide (TPR) repeat protein